MVCGVFVCHLINNLIILISICEYGNLVIKNVFIAGGVVASVVGGYLHSYLLEVEIEAPG